MDQPDKDEAMLTCVNSAGVLGLSSAIKLQKLFAERDVNGISGVQVAIVAREWPTSIPGSPSKHSANYASMWAGAHVRPIPAASPQLQREAKWLRETVSEFSAQVQSEPWAGITRTTGVELLEAPDEGYRKQDAKSFYEETGLPRYRKWADSELPKGVVLGFEYETYCVNSPLYCQSLLRRFILQGGKTLDRDLTSEWEAFGLYANVLLVVNVSGTGFGDTKYFPTRGESTRASICRLVLIERHRPNSRHQHGGRHKDGNSPEQGWHLEFHYPPLLLRGHHCRWHEAARRLVRPSRHWHAGHATGCRARATPICQPRDQ